MKTRTARNWLGIYFLLTASFLGAFFLLAPHSVILPLDDSEAKGIFHIVIPVFVAQIATIFQWISVATADAMEDQADSPIPGWAIILPPSLSLLIVVISAIALAASNQVQASVHVSPEGFRDAVTFALAILNASTVILVARIFPAHHKPKRRGP